MKNLVELRRKELHMTQAELSALSGVPRATISEIENQKSEPRVCTAIALARALKSTVESLFPLN